MVTYEDCVTVREKLHDEESKTIFDARFQYVFDNDWNHFFNNIQKNEDKHYHLGHLKEFLNMNPKKKLVIYGAGMYGKYTLSLLRKEGIDVYGFGDSAVHNEGRCEELPLFVDKEIEAMQNDIVLVIGSRKYAFEIYSKLICMNVSARQIYLPAYGYIDAACGWQYFDFFKPETEEVFVDAGVYDGNSSINFLRWCHNSYSDIYLFEANQKRERFICETLTNNKVQNYNLYLKGLSDKVGTTFFYDNGSGSRIDKCAADQIETTTIDEELKEKRVTFIKMDIEGAERDALIGAEKTIRKYKPKLAVSIYHKQHDFIEIPKLLLKMEPTYQFAFRHYSSTPQESILYAW